MLLAVRNIAARMMSAAAAAVRRCTASVMARLKMGAVEEVLTGSLALLGPVSRMDDVAMTKLVWRRLSASVGTCHGSGTCGALLDFDYAVSDCCSQRGYCGNTIEHGGDGC